MTMSPMLWGAGLACALGGAAVAGNALGSTPVLDRSTIGSFYQSHETVTGPENGGESPPDHYPLVTRAGTVPVGELSMRGLYSQRRYRALAYYTDYVPAEAEIDDYRGEWQPTGFAHADEQADTSPPADLHRQVEASEPAEPLQLAAGPANVEAQGKAKLIDVQATLAMR